MYMYGDVVTVEVIAASKEKAQIDFKLISGGSVEKKEKKTKK